MANVDFSILEQFCELMGDDGKSEAADLVTLYLSDAPEQITAMQRSLESNDSETFRRAAHTFKSSSANVGAFDLQALCQYMETKASAGDMSTLSTSLDATIKNFDLVKQALNQWVNS